jgi:predicted nucleic acid-binding protein
MAGMLLDTSALYAIADRDDKWHRAMVKAVEACVTERIVPVSVLAETCYLLGRYLGPVAERQLLRALIDGELLLEGLDLRDLERADAVLEKYADANIGFVDASIVAVAERLNVGTIATTDRRHFGVIRPKHCRVFDLVP